MFHRIPITSENSCWTEAGSALFFPGRRFRTWSSFHLDKEDPLDPMVEVDTGVQNALESSVGIFKDYSVFIVGQITLPLKWAS